MLASLATMPSSPTTEQNDETLASYLRGGASITFTEIGIKIMNDLRELTTEEFIKHAISMAQTLRGFISYDTTNPKVILFGASVQCPTFPISTDLIESIKLGATNFCVGSGRQMWNAEIVLKTQLDRERTVDLLHLLVSFAEALKQATTRNFDCGCGIGEREQWHFETVNPKNGSKQNHGPYGSITECKIAEVNAGSSGLWITKSCHQ